MGLSHVTVGQEEWHFVSSAELARLPGEQWEATANEAKMLAAARLEAERAVREHENRVKQARARAVADAEAKLAAERRAAESERKRAENERLQAKEKVRQAEYQRISAEAD